MRSTGLKANNADRPDTLSLILACASGLISWFRKRNGFWSRTKEGGVLAHKAGAVARQVLWKRGRACIPGCLERTNGFQVD